MKAFLLSCFVLSSVFQTLAQESCNCCTSSHQQFDFWIGQWTVKNKSGQVVGTNQISKAEDGCILQEKWTGAQGGTGSSMNYFDRTDSTWNQLWVDNKGNVLQLKGKFLNGKMILKSELIDGKNGRYFNQISWNLNQDGTVTQHWELYNDKGVKIRTAFLGTYFRK